MEDGSGWVLGGLPGRFAHPHRSTTCTVCFGTRAVHQSPSTLRRSRRFPPRGPPARRCPCTYRTPRRCGPYSFALPLAQPTPAYLEPTIKGTLLPLSVLSCLSLM